LRFPDLLYASGLPFLRTTIVRHSKWYANLLEAPKPGIRLPFQANWRSLPAKNSRPAPPHVPETGYKCSLLGHSGVNQTPKKHRPSHFRKGRPALRNHTRSSLRWKYGERAPEAGAPKVVGHINDFIDAPGCLL